MNDLAEILVGSLVCFTPPIVLLGGLMLLLRHSRESRDQNRITILEAAIDELRGKNLTLLQRVSHLEAWAETVNAPLVTAGAAVPAPREPAEEPAPALESPQAVPEESGETPRPLDHSSGIGDAEFDHSGEVLEPNLVVPEAVLAASAAAQPPVAPVAPAEAPASQAPAAQAPAPQPPTPPKPSIAWEQWIGVRGAAALGASILVLAGIYFFEYSIEHGLITPAMRMVAGTLVGLGCVLASELRLRRTHTVLANWLAGAGVGILYVAFWAGHSLYGLYPSWASGLLLVGVTGACVTLAVRRDSMAIAVLGLLGGFVTPLALSTGSDRPIPLFGYLLLLDVAMLWLAYRRRWPWLAMLSLVCTGIYEHAWLLERLDEPRLILGVAIVGVFAALFAALPKRADGDEQEPAIWRLTRSAAVVVPLLFTVPLAVRADLGQTFWATAAQLVLLCVAAGWVGIRHRSRALPTTAALIASGVIVGWALSHPPEKALVVWQLAGLGLAIALVFQIFDEVARRRRLDVGTAAPAAVFQVAWLGAAALGGPFALGAGPWPWLAVFALGGVLGARLASREGWGKLQLAHATLVGIGLGGLLVNGLDGLSAALPLGLAVGFAALAQLAGVLPFRTPEARREGDRAAALLAVLVLPFVAAHPGSAAVPSWAVFGAILLLAGFALLVAARSGRAGWMVAALLTAALAGSAYVARFAAGPFDVVTLVGLFAVVLLFVAFPLVAPKRLREDAWSWRVAALAGPLHLLALRHVYLDVVGASTIGLLPIVLGALSLGAAVSVSARGPHAAEAKKTAIVWLTAACSGFVTLAIPLQLENEWVTIGWALEAVALLALWRRLDHPGLKYLAFALAGAVLTRLVFNPYVLEYYPRSSMRVLNWLSYTYLVPAGALVAMWALLRGKEIERRRDWERSVFGDKHAVFANLAASAAIGVVFAWINLTIFDWFASGDALSIPLDRLPARDLAISIAWAVYALFMLGLGMFRRSTALRVASLGLVLVTSAKVFLYDLAHLADLYRVASLAGLAVSLIVISLAYQRFVFRRAEEAPQ